MTRRAALLALTALTGAVAADDTKPPAAEAAAPPSSWQGSATMDEAGQEALDRGLDWLARTWKESLEEEGLAGNDSPFPTKNATQHAPVGITALCTLALLSGGSTPGRGPHAVVVEGALEYLLRLAESNTEHPGYIADSTENLSRTHGHGYATLALAQAFGMSPPSDATRRITNQRLEKALVAAVDLIQTSQGAEGGWEYKPYKSANHEGSVTVCHVQALRAARNAGIKVDGEVIAKAEGYVLRLQKEDGTFRYQLDSERSSVALTAACIGTLNMAGRYDDAVIQSGIDAIWNRLEARRRNGGKSEHPYYERLYLAQALWQLGERKHFDRWFEEERRRILREQRTDGSWRDARYGDCYATAMNCLVLAIPTGLLPIFQR